MRIGNIVTVVAIAIALHSSASDAAIIVLPTVTATTSTGDAGVITSGRRYVRIGVWGASGTSTVLLETRDTDTDGAAPWITVKVMENCDATGLDGDSAPCSFSTLAPPVRVRLRVSACSGCSIKRVIQDVP